MTSMRAARVRIIAQSVYLHGFHRHYLGMFPSNSMKKCMMMCQNNNYCRTATYQSSKQQCHLYEEYSYVGTISSATDGSVVLVFDLCPDDSVATEPAVMCFGLNRKSVPMQTVIDNLQLVKTYSGIYPIGFALAPGEAWIPISGTNSINVYSFNDYSIIRTISTGAVFGYSEFDSQMQTMIMYGNKGIYFSTLNKKFSSGKGLWAACISPTGTVIVNDVSTNAFYVLNQTSATLSFTFTGSTNPSIIGSTNPSIIGSTNPSIIGSKLSCVVYNQTMYIGSIYALQQVSVVPPGGTHIFTSIFNFTGSGPNFVSTDASKRLYSSCIGCPSMNKTFVLTTSGTVLAQWPQTTYYAQGKASKDKYYFVTSTMDQVTSFYEY